MSSRRYILVKVISNKLPTHEALQALIESYARRYLGEVGLAEINPRVLHMNGDRWQATISCSSNSVDQLQAILALVSEVDGIEVSLPVLRVSGTIRGLQKMRPHIKNEQA
jgi:RNase P/RNase MRP subunit POP5